MTAIPPATRPRLYLIDGYALIYRAFFALIQRPLITARGENTNAAWGVARFLQKVQRTYQPDYLAFVMDAGMSERHLIYPEYKATREKMPDELKASLPRIRELVDAWNVPIVEKSPYEADDVIGTLATLASARGIESVIVSGDKDFYQLIDDNVALLNPGRGGASGVEEEWVGPLNASERLGVPPSQVIDYLALIGDASDNVPGAPGVGPKTAVKWLSEYGSIAGLYNHLDALTPKARENLIAHRDQVVMSQKLVTIMRDLEVELDLDALRIQEPDRDRLLRILAELEFNTLRRELFTADASPVAPVAQDDSAPVAASTSGGSATYHLVNDVASVNELVKRARALGSMAVDTETTSLDPLRASLVGVAISLKTGEGFYLPFGHARPDGGLDLDQADVPVNLPPLLSSEMKPLRELLEDASVKKTGQNLKYDLRVLRHNGVELGGVDFDTMIASYVVDPGRRSHGLDALTAELFGHRMISYEEVCGKGKTEISFAQVPLDKATTYSAEDADWTLRLREKLEPQLAERSGTKVFYDVDMPLIEVLAAMEDAGILIDRDYFKQLAVKMEEAREEAQKAIWIEAGQEFNINSRLQLSAILYEKMQMPILKKTKTGASTDAEVLEELAEMGYALPKLLMGYRQLDKLISTYVYALPEAVNPATGRIHTSYSQTVASTGRLASSDPNLQNIPIRSDLGGEIRRGFVPAPGMVFLSCDYSQIELRLLAHFSKDEAFLEAFMQGADIHRETAALVLGKQPEEITSKERSDAKAINFGLIYGMGPFALAKSIGVSQTEAKEFITRYFARFPRVRGWLDGQVEFARKTGYVETLIGRRCYLPGLNDRNFSVRAFSERVATNAPLQGTAADLIKIAMIRVHEMLKGRKDITMLLQVHDELVFEATPAAIEEWKEKIRSVMEGAMTLDVPLRVEAATGPNWLEAK